jgi:predicted DNA-binding protein
MSRKKVSTTIYITPEQAERLKLLHDRTKVPIAVYIREGIDLVLKQYEHMLTVQMTLDSVTPPTPAVAPAPRASKPGAAGQADREAEPRALGEPRR